MAEVLGKGLGWQPPPQEDESSVGGVGVVAVDVMILVTGCFFGMSSGRTLTSVLSLFMTTGDVWEAALL